MWNFTATKSNSYSVYKIYSLYFTKTVWRIEISTNGNEGYRKSEKVKADIFVEIKKGKQRKKIIIESKSQRKINPSDYSYTDNKVVQQYQGVDNDKYTIIVAVSTWQAIKRGSENGDKFPKIREAGYELLLTKDLHKIFKEVNITLPSGEVINLGKEYADFINNPGFYISDQVKQERFAKLIDKLSMQSSIPGILWDI